MAVTAIVLIGLFLKSRDAARCVVAVFALAAQVAGIVMFVIWFSSLKRGS